MALSRRQFLKLGAGAAAALWASPFVDVSRVFASYQGVGLTKFVQPMRGVGPGGIPVALPDPSNAPVTGATHYSLNIAQYTDTLHPALPATTLRGYSPAVALGEGAYPMRHLGGIIVARQNVPIQLTFTNILPEKHILPVDETLMGAGGMGVTGPRNSTSVHLHGGFVPWISDGGPRATWAPGGYLDVSAKAGPQGNIFKLLNPKLQGNQAEYYYPNQQSARMMWYHDHAFGYTRLNAYAGLATAYIIRDSFEESLLGKGLPQFVERGGYELPIVFQDKVFVGTDIGRTDPGWVNLGLPSTKGSLWYPHTYDPADLGAGTYLPLPATSCVPEMFGDTMLANGTAYPVASVEPRRYRLRILNACQARFLNIQLYVADNTGFKKSSTKGPDFLVIGTEGGFLPKPVWRSSGIPISYDSEGVANNTGSLLTAPAERWDLLVDFSGFEGKSIILYNDAPAPFPEGDPAVDLDGDSAGPDTRNIMRFDVGKKVTAPVDAPLDIGPDSSLLDGNDPLLVPLGVAVQPDGSVKLPPGVQVRQLTLNEDYDGFGRLIQMLGTNKPGSLGFGRAYMDAATETPKAGSTEVWQIANLTGDTHPIHFHLVNVQIISRQPFDVDNYKGSPRYTGPARPPEQIECGWKETVKMNPGEVTTVIMKFKLPTLPFAVPTSPSYGGKGYEYVWHCHILEHEEHDMMRPLIVMP